MHVYFKIPIKKYQKTPDAYIKPEQMGAILDQSWWLSFFVDHISGKLYDKIPLSFAVKQPPVEDDSGQEIPARG